jgi:hypothetical protein
MNTQIDNFYNELPTEEQFNSFQKWFEEENEQMRKNADYRMQNYFDCVDDYSWGGLCDKAAGEAYSKRLRLHNQLIGQLREGAFIEDFSISVLTDMEGNIVSDKIVNGRYGQCWIIQNNGSVSFVGLAKKQQTYNKKGYKVMTKVYKIEYYYKTNGKIISRLLSEELIDSILESQSTWKPIELMATIN